VYNFIMDERLKRLPALLKPREVAEFFRTSQISVKRWEKNGWLIPIRVGSRRDRLYRKEDIKAIYEGTKTLGD
jgi:predicted site-specific integrase-resolvase